MRGAGAAPTPEPACGRAPPPLGGPACLSPRHRRSPAAGRRPPDVNKKPDFPGGSLRSFQPRRALSPQRPLTHSCQPPQCGEGAESVAWQHLLPPVRPEFPAAKAAVGYGGWRARDSLPGAQPRRAQGRQPAVVARARQVASKRRDRSGSRERPAEAIRDSSPAFPFALVPPPELFALQQRSWVLFGVKIRALAARAQVGGGGRAESGIPHGIRRPGRHARRVQGPPGSPG